MFLEMEHMVAYRDRRTDKTDYNVLVLFYYSTYIHGIVGIGHCLVISGEVVDVNTIGFQLSHYLNKTHKEIFKIH